jgi:methylmalonyl-CoA epimerase
MTLPLESAGRKPQDAPMSEPFVGLPAGVLDVGRVHHVAVVVREMNAALRFYRDTLGLAPGPVVPIPPDRVNIAFLPVGEVKIELVEPTDETTGVARFLATRGEGFHHVCFEVADIAATLNRLAAEGVQLIDAAPRPGAEGPVAFLHPKSCHGVLVELIEAPGGPAWAALYPAGFRAPGSAG